MRKYWLFMWLLLPSFAYAQISGQIRVPAEHVRYEKVMEYDKILWGDTYIKELGYPELPVVYKSYLIPKGAAHVNIEPRLTKAEQVNGTFRVYPVQKPQIPGGSSQGDFINPVPLIYGSGNQFPDKLAEIVSDGDVQGFRVVTIAFYPVSYLPATKELYLRDIAFALDYENGLSQDVTLSKISFRRFNLAKEFVRSMVENPSDMEGYATTYNVVPESTVVNGNEDTQSRIRRGDILDEIVPDYVIITNNQLKSAFQRLADWRIKTGIPTIIKTVEEIDKEYSGGYLVDKIRNYLLDVGKRWSNNSLFILLGGDIEIVPSRVVKSTLPDEKDTPQVTDIVYTVKKYTWNLGDYKYIKSDSGNVVSSYLGRIPVKTVDEANTFISKLLNYEKAPVNGKCQYSYFNNFLISDAYTNEKTKLTDGAMNPIDGYCKRNRNSTSQFWYLFDHFKCRCGRSDHYPNKFYDYDATYGEELNRENMLSALQNGRTFKAPNAEQFHFVYHMDHSWPTNMGSSFANKNQCFTLGNVDNMPDTYYPKIIMSGGCHPADFSRDCMAEHFLKKPNGGAIAFIGNTDVGYVNEYWQFEKLLIPLFKTNQESPFQYNIGYLFLKSGIMGSSLSVFSQRLHLLGDPAMPVWTAEPKNLQVSSGSYEMSNGGVQLDVDVKNLPEGQQALICVMKDDEVYETRTITSKYHNESFTIMPVTSGYLNITVTAHNFRPYESQIYISRKVNSTIQISDLVFNDTKRDDIVVGNGDGKLDAGETVELAVKLRNRGEISALIDYCALRCDHPSIEILGQNTEFGYIDPDATVEGKSKFRFRIAKDAPGILKNDFNAVKFWLEMADSGRGDIYYDAFNVDIYSPEIELDGQTVSGSMLPGTEVRVNIYLKNVGKGAVTRLWATVSVDPASGTLSRPTAIFPDMPVNGSGSNLVPLVVRLADNYQQGQPINLTLILSNAYGKEWPAFVFNALDRAGRINGSEIKTTSCSDGIELYWPAMTGVKGFNIYRSDNGVSGNFFRLNPRPVSDAYFKDPDLDSYKTYYYKVTAVSVFGNEGDLSTAVLGKACYPLTGMFPRNMKYSTFSNTSVNVADVDYNGKKEIFLSCSLDQDSKEGFLVGLDYMGRELINSNPGYVNGLVKLPTGATGTPAIGDLNGDSEQYVVVPTWNDNVPSLNVVSCYAPKDLNRDNIADKLWENKVMATHYRGAILSNLDNSVDGSMETIVKSNGYSTIKILDNKGNLIREIGAGSTYSMPAVADLDGDGDKEIIACFDTGGLNIWHHDGKPFSVNLPYLSGTVLSSSPVVCDLNKDGKKEIIVSQKYTSTSKIFVIDLNGNALKGWNGTQSIPYSSAPNSGLDHMVSVGDINGDGMPEVVSLGLNVVKAWRYDGTLLFEKRMDGIFIDSNYKVNKRVPILADVDGDSRADVIFNVNSKMYALNWKGEIIPGFPMMANTAMDGNPCVADIDNDGKNELIVVDTDAHIYVWKTNGRPDGIEWGSERHDAQNTGEYGKNCEPTLIFSNTTWNGITPCGSVIVQAGKFTIPAGKNLMLPGKTSKIVVRPGATLEVDGGTVSNAYIRALPGGSVILKNGGSLLLRDQGDLTIDTGATFDYQYGTID